MRSLWDSCSASRASYSARSFAIAASARRSAGSESRTEVSAPADCSAAQRFSAGIAYATPLPCSATATIIPHTTLPRSSSTGEPENPLSTVKPRAEFLGSICRQPRGMLLPPISWHLLAVALVVGLCAVDQNRPALRRHALGDRW